VGESGGAIPAVNHTAADDNAPLPMAQRSSRHLSPLPQQTNDGPPNTPTPASVLRYVIESAGPGNDLAMQDAAEGSTEFSQWLDLYMAAESYESPLHPGWGP
jgi:hypothetical protein